MSRPQSRFCREIRPPLPGSAEGTSKLSPFFELCERQSVVLVPTMHRTCGNPISVTIWNRLVLEIWGNSSERSEIVKRFSRTTWSTLWTSSSVTIECRPCPPLSCTSVRPSLNFLHQSLTELSLIYHCTHDTIDDEPRRHCVLLLAENESHHGPHSWRVHVYSVATRAQLKKLDCGLAFSEITLYWLLQEMRRVAAQPVYFYQPIGGLFWNSSHIYVSVFLGPQTMGQPKTIYE
jgi:hypothetical protein